MKSNKVLLGLFVGFMALIGGSVSAQDTNFYELGPDNIGGNVTRLVVDMGDSNGTTVYASAIGGGLFVRSGSDQVLQNLYTRLNKDLSLAENHDIWHKVPYFEGNKESELPINSMAQSPDGTIIIGTGDNNYLLGSSYGPMSSLGRGIYRFNPETLEFKLVPGTKPDSVGDKFAAVRDIDLLERDGVLYVYAVTGTGLYRWVINGDVWDDSKWANCETVFEGTVDQMLIVQSLKTAYFTVGNQLYLIGDVTASSIVCANISTGNSAFGGSNKAIKLAVAPSDPTYLYAMVIDTNGLMQGLYLTRNMQTWSTLTTSTVTPFTRVAVNNVYYNSGDGRYTGAMAVDPTNPKHIYIGGSSIWSGEGFIENGYYQWTKVSLCEDELNSGNYMSTVFGNYMFVHSGINQIIPVYREADGYGYYEWYIATEGGVYTTNYFGYYNNINRGLNNLQINSVAVCPDGSVISGAYNNSCPMIESRLDHNGGNGTISWYDNGTLGNLNHDGNVLWKGDGGKVAASMFQAIEPKPRRSIFVSSNGGSFARAYADYLDYNQTQTWTIGSDFASNRPAQGPLVGEYYLWETDHDNIFNDSLTVHIDTLGSVRRPNNDGGFDTVAITGSNFQIKAGDVIDVPSRANSEYPFEYTFTRNQKAKDNVRVKNPIQSRSLLIAVDNTSENLWTVYMSWRATDFSKVWDAGIQSIAGDDWSSLNMWAQIYIINAEGTRENDRPRTMAMSSDGRAVYIAVQNTVENKSMLVRVRGFENIDFSAPTKDILAAMRCRYFSGSTVLVTDTLQATATSRWFPRVISSITVDTSTADERLILTFEGYNDNYANVAIVNNILAPTMTVEPVSITNNKKLPTYCAMVEQTTNDLYVGTTNGVWVKSGDVWSKYEHLDGVAVTSMVQQKANLPVRRFLGHNGINPEKHLYAKTKWPGAMYFGTYGRGIFMDMTYVTDRTNEISDSSDYNNVGIPTVVATSAGSINVFPNPVSGDAHMTLTAAEAGNAQLRIYDLNGRCVMDRQLGYANEGEQTFTVSTEGMAKGMYLVNVIIGGRTSAAKMMVR